VEQQKVLATGGDAMPEPEKSERFNSQQRPVRPPEAAGINGFRKGGQVFVDEQHDEGRKRGKGEKKIFQQAPS
jgi:hypothetical protein